jgi:type IV secretion system protein VirD4
LAPPTTINATLKFMQHPGVVAAVCPPPGEGLDFTAFVSSTDTLYLVASDKSSPVAPLFAALCAELTWVARQVGGIRRPARPPRARVLGSARLARVASRLFPVRAVSRLDPPLDLVLDEAANICPVPVAAWATWAAGSGIRLHVYSQAWAQLVERWGEHGAAVIWQACKTKIIYTSTTEPALAKMVEDACGQVRARGPDEWQYTRFGKPRRRPSYEQVPALPQSALRQLPAGHAVVLQGNAPPAIVRVEQVWRRADVRAWHRRGGLALPVPPQRPVPEPIPALMASLGETPAGPVPPAGDLASFPGDGPPADPGPPPLPGSGPSGAPHWTDHLPEIPRDLFIPRPPAQPAESQPPFRPRRPPSRPAPWQPRDDTEEDR